MVMMTMTMMMMMMMMIPMMVMVKRYDRKHDTGDHFHEYDQQRWVAQIPTFHPFPLTSKI